MAATAPAIGSAVGGLAGATPYGAALGAVGSIATGILEATAEPPPPPDFSTRAINRKSDRFTVGFIAPSLSINVGSRGLASIATTPSTTIPGDTSQRATATGGQGTKSGESFLNDLAAEPTTLAIGAVALVAVVFLFRSKK